MNNKYYKLDLNEFFKDEYKELNYSEGIGGMGIVTENQIVNVYNDYALNKKDNKEYLGLGFHEDMTNRLLKDMYGKEHKYLDKFLYQLISIKYWNSPYSKIILMYLPVLITEKEFNNLCLLEEYYKEIFEKKEIAIGVYTFGTNVQEYGPEIQTNSNITSILDYASKRIDKTLKREYKDKKIII